MSTPQQFDTQAEYQSFVTTLHDSTTHSPRDVAGAVISSTETIDGDQIHGTTVDPYGGGGIALSNGEMLTTPVHPATVIKHADVDPHPEIPDDGTSVYLERVMLTLAMEAVANTQE